MFLLLIIAFFVLVNTVQTQLSPTPNIIQNCQYIECLENGGTIACNCGQVNTSDNTYASGGGLEADSGLAQVRTWHNQTVITTGSQIINATLSIEWRRISTGGVCTIEVWNGSWINLSGVSCPGSEITEIYILNSILIKV